MDDQQSTPQSHKPIVSPSSQGNRFRHSRLPESTEIALLTFFSTARFGDAREFTRFCWDRNLVFGDPKGTKAQKNLRTAVKNRRAYLSNNPRTLEACLVGRGLPVPSFIYRNSSSSRSLVVQSPPPDLSSLTSVLTPATPTKTLPTPSKSPIKTLPPPSKDRVVVSRSRMADGEFEYDINFDEPWKNPENILVVQGKRSPLNSKEVVDRVNFYVPVLDIRDFESGRYRASISEDGTKATFIMPGLACYQWKKATTIQNAETSFTHGVDSKILEQHKIFSAKVAANPKIVEKSITLVMDEGRTINNEHFNGNASGLDLEPRIRRRGVAFTDKKGNAQEAVHFFAWFSVAVDGTVVLIEKHQDDSEVEQVGRMLQESIVFEPDVESSSHRHSSFATNLSEESRQGPEEVPSSPEFCHNSNLEATRTAETRRILLQRKRQEEKNAADARRIAAEEKRKRQVSERRQRQEGYEEARHFAARQEEIAASEARRIAADARREEERKQLEETEIEARRILSMEEERKRQEESAAAETRREEERKQQIEEARKREIAAAEAFRIAAEEEERKRQEEFAAAETRRIANEMRLGEIAAADALRIATEEEERNRQEEFAVAETRRVAIEMEEARRRATEEEGQRLGEIATAEALRIAGEEEERKRQEDFAAAETRRIAVEMEEAHRRATEEEEGKRSIATEEEDERKRQEERKRHEMFASAENLRQQRHEEIETTTQVAAKDSKEYFNVERNQPRRSLRVQHKRQQSDGVRASPMKFSAISRVDHVSRSKSDSEKGCVCGRVHSNPIGKNMFWILCSHCDKWHHVAIICIGITEREARSMKSWICPTCKEVDSQALTRIDG